MKAKECTYQVLAFREFETEQVISEAKISAMFNGWDVAGCGLSNLRVRHVALLKCTGWPFKNALVIVYGEAAKRVKKDAIAAGVYEKADPGAHKHDSQCALDRSPSRSGEHWYTVYSTSTTTSTHYYAYS